VVPLGYTFNLEGATVYLSLAVAFIANSYNLSLSLATLISIVLLLTFISKTIATVPSGAIVVLLATASQLGLPKEGVALIFAVDFLLTRAELHLMFSVTQLLPRPLIESWNLLQLFQLKPQKNKIGVDNNVSNTTKSLRLT